MNEALQDAYSLFTQGGYNGTIEEFTTLISTNPDALNDSFGLFAGGGYNGTIDDYVELIGLKKNDESEITMGLPLEDGLSEPFDEKSETFAYIGYDPYEKFRPANQSFVDKKLASGFKRVASDLSRVPLGFMEFANTVTSKFYDDIAEQTKDLSREEFAEYRGMKGLSELSDKFLAEAEEIDSTLEQFDTTITEDLLSLKLGQGGKRLFGEVIGAIPSLALVLSNPYGFAMLGAGAAAGKSRELQDEGFERNLKTTANAIGTGVAEGAFELITRGLGRGVYKNLSNVSREAAEVQLKKIRNEFAKGFGLEGASEATTLATEKVLDALLLEDETAFDNAFYELMDTFLIGGFVGGPLKAGPVGIQKIRLSREYANIQKVLEGTEYTNMIEPFQQEDFQVDLQQLPLVEIPAVESFIKGTLNNQVANGEITQEQADQVLLNFEESVSIFNSIPDNFTEQQKEEVIPLLQKKRDLLKLIEQSDDAAAKEYKNQLDSVNSQIENISLNTPETISIRAQEAAKEAQANRLNLVINEITNPDAEVTTTLRQRRNVLQRAQEELQKQAPSELRDRVTEAIAKDAAANELQVRDYLELPGGVPRTVNQVIEKVTLDNVIQQEGRVLRKLADEKLTPEIRKKAFINLIKNIQPKGKIGARKAKALINRVNETNFNNAKKVDETYQYIQNTFLTAKVKQKYTDAAKLISDIKKKLRRPNIDGYVVKSAEQFLKLDPNLVSDIDTYLEQATQLNKGLTPTKRRGTKVNIGQAVNLESLNEYTLPEIEAEQERLAETINDTFEELTGLTPDEFSLSQMRDIIEELNDDSISAPNKLLENERFIKTGLKNAFEVYSDVVSKQIETGKDVFTGKKVELSENNKDVVKRFMEIDVTKLDTKEAIMALDSLINFATNGQTGGMEAVNKTYEGMINAEKAVEEGIEARTLKSFYESVDVTQTLKNNRLYAQYLRSLGTLPLLIENQFKGQDSAMNFMNISGVSDLIREANYAEKESRDIDNEYANEFVNTKPNNESFITAKNNIERGMFAFVRRNVVGTEKQQQVEFDRRKKLIKESIPVLLENGQDKKAKVYQEVYNKILKDASNIDDVQAKVDKINIEAVDWMTNKWSEYYPELQEVDYNIYNSVLDSDINYTPDVFQKFKQEVTPDIKSKIFVSPEYQRRKKIYNEKTGVLLPNKRVKSLEPGQFINLSFDTQNISLLRKAITNIKTAGINHQVQAFIDSPNFRKIMPDELDSRIFKERVSKYVDEVRQRNITPAEDKLANQTIQTITSFGVAKALVSVGQTIKQFSPFASTIVTAGGANALNGMSTYMGNKEAREWMRKNAGAINNRGIGQETLLDDIDTSIKEAEIDPSPFKRAASFSNRIAQKGLKIFLQNSDIMTARMSWLTFYGQQMKQLEGVDVFDSNFDWENHTVNNLAADRAQYQVDRQQNVSDQKLQGLIYRDRKPQTRFAINVFLPFSNFLINLKTRMYTDIGVLSSRSASSVDRGAALRSLAGVGAEMAMFNGLSVAIQSLIYSISDYFTGEEDEEKIEERFNNYLKSRAGSFATDLTSPLPVFDFYALKMLNYYFEKAGNYFGYEDPFQFYNSPTELENDLGTLSVGIQQVKDAFEELSLGVDGVIKTEYRGEEIEYELSEDEKLLLQMSQLAKLGYIIGLPAEFGRIADRNIKFLEDKAKQPPTRFKPMTKKQKKEAGIIE